MAEISQKNYSAEVALAVISAVNFWHKAIVVFSVTFSVAWYATDPLSMRLSFDLICEDA